MEMGCMASLRLLLGVLVAAALALHSPTLLATEVSSSDWSETAGSNNQAAPNGWPEGMAPSAVNDAAREMMAVLKRWWNRSNPALSSGGSSNAYTLTPTSALAAYVDGEVYCFQANHTNTGTSTLNISALGAKTLKKYVNAAASALAAGDVTSGQPVCAAYDGTDMILLSPPGTSLDSSSGIAQGVHTISFSAGGLTSRTTNGCASGTTESSTNDIMYITKDCDTSTSEGVQAMVGMPVSWNEGVIKYQVYWRAGVTGGVTWSMRCAAISDDDLLDATWGTAVDVEDDVTATTDLMVSARSGDVTCGGSPASADLVVFELFRDVSDDGDDAAGDAGIVQLDVFYTVSAGTD